VPAHILYAITILELFLFMLAQEEVLWGHAVASYDVCNQVNSPNQRFELMILASYQ